MIEEVTISTLPVEIKVVRIGGHKMTIAVFNQIPHCRLVDILLMHYDNMDIVISNAADWYNAYKELLESGQIRPLGYVRRDSGIIYLLFTDGFGDLMKSRIDQYASEQLALAQIKVPVSQRLTTLLLCDNPQLYIAT